MKPDRIGAHWRKRGLKLVALDGHDASAPPADEPEARAAGRQGLQRFAAALAALPEAQRAAFLLHEESGLSVAEIAAATGANEETAKSRVRYALAKLREAMSDD